LKTEECIQLQVLTTNGLSTRGRTGKKGRVEEQGRSGGEGQVPVASRLGEVATHLFVESAPVVDQKPVISDAAAQQGKRMRKA